MEGDSHKSIFFTNLLLLGFDPVLVEKKMRIPFNKDMFQLPNKTGFEIVTHFLFNKLNPVQCHEAFRYCWPVIDKSGEQQFRRQSYAWLSNISQEDPEARLPRINAALFLSPSGDRFYELLFAFSSYVLFKECFKHKLKKGDYILWPTVTSEVHSADMAPIIDSMLQCATVRRRETLLERVQQISAVQDRWKQYASELVKNHRSLTKALRDKERPVAELRKAVLCNSSSRGSPVKPKQSRATDDYDYDILTVKRAQAVSQVRDMWSQFDDFHVKTEKEREIVDSILEGTHDKYRVDGSKLNIRVPDLLLRKCHKEIEQREIENIYDGGKVNLLSLVQLCNLSLHIYIEKLHQEGLISLDDVEPAITSQVHTQQAHLANTEALGQKLAEEVIPGVKASVVSLKRQLDGLPGCYPTTPNNTSTSTPDVFWAHNQRLYQSMGMVLMPPTPPVSFEPQEGSTPPGSPAVHMAQQMNIPSKTVATPEAAQDLMASVNKSVRSGRGAALRQGAPVYNMQPDLGAEPGSKLSGSSRLAVQPGRLLEVERTGNKQRTRLRPSPSNGHSAPYHDNKQAPTETGRPPPKKPPARDAHALRIRQRPAASRGQPLKASHSTTGGQHQSALPRPTMSDSSVSGLPHGSRGSTRGATTPVPKKRKATTSLKAHQLLIDQIADAVMGDVAVSGDVDFEDQLTSAVDNFNLQNPLEALGHTAFSARDKLHRTPPDSADAVTSWHESDLRAQGESTRPAFDRRSGEELATKLFDVKERQGPDRERAAGTGRVASSTLGSGAASRVPPIGRLLGSPSLDDQLSAISSISPRSVDSLQREGGKRHSTMLHELGELDADLAGLDLEEVPADLQPGLPLDDDTLAGSSSPSSSPHWVRGGARGAAHPGELSPSQRTPPAAARGDQYLEASDSHDSTIRRGDSQGSHGNTIRSGDSQGSHGNTIRSGDSQGSHGNTIRCGDSQGYHGNIVRSGDTDAIGLSFLPPGGAALERSQLIGQRESLRNEATGLEGTLVTSEHSEVVPDMTSPPRIPGDSGRIRLDLSWQSPECATPPPVDNDSDLDLLPTDEFHRTFLGSKTPWLTKRSRPANGAGAGGPGAEDACLDSPPRITQAEAGLLDDIFLSRTPTKGILDMEDKHVGIEKWMDDEFSDPEESIRVIEFQNGSFNEFLVQSPVKSHTKYPSEHNSGVRLDSHPAQGIQEEPHPGSGSMRDPDTASRHLPGGGDGAQEGATADLIARYMKLRKTGTSDADQTLGLDVSKSGRHGDVPEGILVSLDP